MKINGWDISEANAKQWNVIPGSHSIENESEWVRGSPVPMLLPNTLGFKTMKVTLLIRAEKDRQQILNQCSRILSRFLEPAELILDGFLHSFYGILKKYSFEENPLNIWPLEANRAAKLTLEFNCYECGEVIEQTFGEGMEHTVQNPGNLPSPVVVTITPLVGAASAVLTGICKDPNTGEELPVTVRELATGKAVILDGEQGLFTQEGKNKAGDLEIWELPMLLPGENKITINNARMDLIVKFRPRFM